MTNKFKTGAAHHRQFMKILNNSFDVQILIRLLVRQAGGVVALDVEWAQANSDIHNQELYAHWDKKKGLTIWLDRANPTDSET
jgi:hypothetical protein